MPRLDGMEVLRRCVDVKEDKWSLQADWLAHADITKRTIAISLTIPPSPPQVALAFWPVCNSCRHQFLRSQLFLPCD